MTAAQNCRAIQPIDTGPERHRRDLPGRATRLAGPLTTPRVIDETTVSRSILDATMPIVIRVADTPSIRDVSRPDSAR